MKYSEVINNPYFTMLVQYAIDFILNTRGSSKEDFVEYIQSKNDTNLVQYIQQNEQLANYLANMIQDKSDETKKQLAGINSMLASIMANTKAFAPVASIMNIQSDLSEQAIDILRRFIESGSDLFLKVQTLQETIIVMTKGKNFVPDEQRFIDDDLDMLVKYGFLIKGYNSSGGETFKPTREAFKFIDSLPKEEKNG